MEEEFITLENLDRQSYGTKAQPSMQQKSQNQSNTTALLQSPPSAQPDQPPGLSSDNLNHHHQSSLQDSGLHHTNQALYPSDGVYHGDGNYHHGYPTPHGQTSFHPYPTQIGAPSQPTTQTMASQYNYSDRQPDFNSRQSPKHPPIQNRGQSRSTEPEAQLLTDQSSSDPRFPSPRSQHQSYDYPHWQQDPVMQQYQSLPPPQSNSWPQTPEISWQQAPTMTDHSFPPHPAMVDDQYPGHYSQHYSQQGFPPQMYNQYSYQSVPSQQYHQMVPPYTTHPQEPQQQSQQQTQQRQQQQQQQQQPQQQAQSQQSSQIHPPLPTQDIKMPLTTNALSKSGHGMPPSTQQKQNAFQNLLDCVKKSEEKFDKTGESKNVKNDKNEKPVKPKVPETPASRGKGTKRKTSADRETVKAEPNIDDSDDENSSKLQKAANRKKLFERKNIRDIIAENELEATTVAAQKEEQERKRRLQEAQQRALVEKFNQVIQEAEQETAAKVAAEAAANSERIAAAERAAKANMLANEEAAARAKANRLAMPMTLANLKRETDVILVESSDDDDKRKRSMQISMKNVNLKSNPVITVSSSEEDSSSSSTDDTSSDEEDESVLERKVPKDDDCVMVLSDDDDDDDSSLNEDPNNSGSHTNDIFNQPDPEGRVLVNVGHPPEDEDIFLAPQLARAVKPHQIGGIRFLFDNVIESVSRFSTSSGFGCILAHSMGLGKTIQVISLTDTFLRHTTARTVLAIVPINTIQNWMSEFNMWLPSETAVPQLLVDSNEIRPRSFPVYLLNENYRTTSARAKIINEWNTTGGVMLMGYELYRMLALKKPAKVAKRRKNRKKEDINPIEIEDESAETKYLDDIFLALVNPGPDLVVCDEGHRIKNCSASTSAALKKIHTKRRVVLTGYPLQNNLLEYWCMVDFVRPNYLGSRSEFVNMFERPIQNGQCIDSTPRDRQLMRYRAHVLHSLLEGFVQRRGHAVLRTSLPVKEEHVILIRMTEVQRRLYREFVRDFHTRSNSTNPLLFFAVCCKIWNHPDVLYNFIKNLKGLPGVFADNDLDIDLVNTTPAIQNKPTIGFNNTSMGIPNQLPIKVENHRNCLPPLMHSPYGHSNAMPTSTSNSNANSPEIGSNTFNASNSSESNNSNPFFSSIANSIKSSSPDTVGAKPDSTNFSNHPTSNDGSPRNTASIKCSMDSNNSNSNSANYSSITNNYTESSIADNSTGTIVSDKCDLTCNSEVIENGQDDNGIMKSGSLPVNNVMGHLNSGTMATSIPASQGVQNSGPFSESNSGYVPIKYSNCDPNPDSRMVMKSPSLGSLLSNSVGSRMPPNSLPGLNTNMMQGGMHNKNNNTTNGVMMKSASVENMFPPIPCENNIITTPTVKEKPEPAISYDWAKIMMEKYQPGVISNCHKMSMLFAIIEQSLAIGDKLLVFSQSLLTLDLIERFLCERQLPERPNIMPGERWAKNVNYCRLDGKTHAQERERLINNFNNNHTMYLFLLSTRAGCLGINLIGANRIVVYDASWNPCHDAQAVCRIYRYGQQKPCYIYRLVTDNCLEKKVYDRQVNKQGMSDRVVDELNPESNFTWKEVSTLVSESEDDGPEINFSEAAPKYTDHMLQYMCTAMSKCLSKEPFEHESLLLDRKELKLTKQEKKLAKQSYELEKRGNACGYGRGYTYTRGGIMQRGGYQGSRGPMGFATPTGVQGPRFLPNQSSPVPNQWNRNQKNNNATVLIRALLHQGVMVRRVTPSNGDSSTVTIPAGQEVLVMRTPKGVYLRVPDGRIIAVRLPQELLNQWQAIGTTTTIGLGGPPTPRPNLLRTTMMTSTTNTTTTTSNSKGNFGTKIVQANLQCGGSVKIAQDGNPEVIDLSDDEEKQRNTQTIESVISRGGPHSTATTTTLTTTTVSAGAMTRIRPGMPRIIKVPIPSHELKKAATGGQPARIIIRQVQRHPNSANVIGNTQQAVTITRQNTQGGTPSITITRVPPSTTVAGNSPINPGPIKVSQSPEQFQKLMGPNIRKGLPQNITIVRHPLPANQKGPMMRAPGSHPNLRGATYSNLRSHIHKHEDQNLKKLQPIKSTDSQGILEQNQQMSPISEPISEKLPPMTTQGPAGQSFSQQLPGQSVLQKEISDSSQSNNNNFEIPSSAMKSYSGIQRRNSSEKKSSLLHSMENSSDNSNQNPETATHATGHSMSMLSLPAQQSGTPSIQQNGPELQHDMYKSQTAMNQSRENFQSNQQPTLLNLDQPQHSSNPTSKRRSRNNHLGMQAMNSEMNSDGPGQPILTPQLMNYDSPSLSPSNHLTLLGEPQNVKSKSRLSEKINQADNAVMSLNSFPYNPQLPGDPNLGFPGLDPLPPNPTTLRAYGDDPYRPDPLGFPHDRSFGMYEQNYYSPDTLGRGDSGFSSYGISNQGYSTFPSMHFGEQPSHMPNYFDPNSAPPFNHYSGSLHSLDQRSGFNYSSYATPAASSSPHVANHPPSYLPNFDSFSAASSPSQKYNSASPVNNTSNANAGLNRQSPFSSATFASRHHFISPPPQESTPPTTTGTTSGSQIMTQGYGYQPVSSYSSSSPSQPLQNIYNPPLP